MAINFDFLMNDAVNASRKEIADAGYTELRTPEAVDEALQKKGTAFVMINSVCGCAGGIARPAAAYAANLEHTPDQLVTVFAGQDKEATARAREYFTGYPPSSPSFAFLKDGQIVKMIERHEIEGAEPIDVANKIEELFETHCS